LTLAQGEARLLSRSLVTFGCDIGIVGSKDQVNELVPALPIRIARCYPTERTSRCDTRNASIQSW